MACGKHNIEKRIVLFCELSEKLPDEVDVKEGEGSITVSPVNDSKRARSMWGLSRSLVSNMMTGVSTGFTRNLVISGVGYRAAIDGKILNLQLGYSHDIKVAIPDDIQVKCATPTQISISGADRQRVQSAFWYKHYTYELHLLLRDPIVAPILFS